MLPGIRFLLAAVLLSISIVVFGLGAAALLRAAHEDFASNPSWRVTPETRFAQNEMPSLALLRVETPAPTARPADVPDSVAPETSATPAAPTEQVTTVSPVPETTVAPVATPAAPAPDAMKTEAPPAPASPSSEPSPAVASETAPQSEHTNKPDATQEAKVAAIESSDTPPKTSDTSPATSDPVKPDLASSEPPQPEVAKSETSSAEAAKPEQTIAPPAPETAAPTKIARLDAPAVKVEEPSPTKAEARRAAERAADKERARAEKKAKARRRLAAQRARAARQTAAQRAADPFGQTTSSQPARTP